MAVNFSSSTPAAPAGNTNVAFQTDGSGNVSANIGVPAKTYDALNASLTANLNAGAALTLFTPTVAAMYRISWSQAIVVAGGSSSTFPSLTLGWTDVGGIARTKVLVSTSTANTTAVESDGVVAIYTNGSTAVTVTSASYASAGVPSMAYSLALEAEQI